jgi:ketosteroid isomerase-like protein
MRFVHSLPCIAAGLMMTAFPAFADSTELMERWYAALMKPDRAVLMGMLSPDAQITLEDLDLTQNRDEFIQSMDEWEESVKGATEQHKLDSEVDGVVTMLVCYRFPDNQLLVRETFTVTGDIITGSTQATVAETCDDF